MQLLIFAFSALAIWLIASPSPRSQRWGALFGLAGQPFWLLETWSAQQLGIFALSIFYTVAWARAVRTHWFGRT